MAHFLIEAENRKEILFDLCWEIKLAIDYQKWYNSSYSHTYQLCDIKDLKYIPDLNLTYPIGSIQFVHRFFEILNVPIPLPINIPEQLNKYDFLKREISHAKMKDIYKIDKFPIFIKPSKEIKLFTGCVVDKKHFEDNSIYTLYSDLSEETDVMMSDLIDISSEYRCFVYSGNLVGIKHYLGDFKLFPDIYKIEDMISAYTDSPISYVMDVGIIERKTSSTHLDLSGNINDTVLIEVHNFYSNGLYGFNDDKHIFRMCISWMNSYLKRF